MLPNWHPLPPTGCRAAKTWRWQWPVARQLAAASGQASSSAFQVRSVQQLSSAACAPLHTGLSSAGSCCLLIYAAQPLSLAANRRTLAQRRARRPRARSLPLPSCALPQRGGQRRPTAAILPAAEGRRCSCCCAWTELNGRQGTRAAPPSVLVLRGGWRAPVFAAPRQRRRGARRHLEWSQRRRRADACDARRAGGGGTCAAAHMFQCSHVCARSQKIHPQVRQQPSKAPAVHTAASTPQPCAETRVSTAAYKALADRIGTGAGLAVGVVCVALLVVRVRVHLKSR